MARLEVSMSSKRHTDEFKIEAVRQVTDCGFKVADVAERLGNHTQSVRVDSEVRQTWRRAAG